MIYGRRGKSIYSGRRNLSVLRKTINECINEGIDEIDFVLFDEICTFDFMYPDEPMYINSYGAAYELDRNSTESLLSLLYDMEDESFDYDEDIKDLKVSKNSVQDKEDNVTEEEETQATNEIKQDKSFLKKTVAECIEEKVWCVWIVLSNQQEPCFLIPYSVNYENGDWPTYFLDSDEDEGKTIQKREYSKSLYDIMKKYNRNVSFDDVDEVTVRYW